MSEYVLLQDIADQCGIDRSNMRRYALKHGFTFLNVRTSESRGQLTLALTSEDAEALKDLRQRQGFNGAAVATEDNSVGVFYVVQIIPEYDPNRVKLGYTAGLDARVQAYQTVSPTARLVRFWPCRRGWEEAAIASLTREGCTQIGGEVYQCESMDALIGRGDAFFALMPR